MLSLTRHHSHPQILSTSMVLSLMQPSHTRLTQIDISAHSKLLIRVFTSRTRRDLEIQAITLPLSCTLRDLKIFPSSTESETSSEFTEQLSDSTRTKDNSMLTFSTTALGLYSPLTRSQLFKRLEARK